VKENPHKKLPELPDTEGSQLPQIPSSTTYDWSAPRVYIWLRLPRLDFPLFTDDFKLRDFNATNKRAKLVTIFIDIEIIRFKSFSFKYDLLKINYILI
jgi:hypothetical protein